MIRGGVDTVMVKVKLVIMAQLIQYIIASIMDTMDIITSIMDTMDIIKSTMDIIIKECIYVLAAIVQDLNRNYQKDTAFTN